MEVQIVLFPETKVAAIEHHGSPALEHETAKKLIFWRQRNQLDRDRHRSYGVHSLARHFGSREHNTAAVFLYREWLPASGEALGDFPIFFHYGNVGPDVKASEMITDVYLPLKG